ncbi:MAG: Spy/CpxP family protein refolding chaperone [Blastocatellia bacterium]
MNSQGKVKLQVWLLIAVVFALGAVTGASLDRVYLNRSGPSSDHPDRGPRGRGFDRMVERMRKDLNLNDEQVPKIRTIFEESRKEFPQRRFLDCPGYKESRDRTRARIREVLTPEQQKRYDEINAQRDADMGKDH